MLSFRPKGGISDSANDRDVSTSLRFARHDRTTFILSTYLSTRLLGRWRGVGPGAGGRGVADARLGNVATAALRPRSGSGDGEHGQRRPTRDRGIALLPQSLAESLAALEQDPVLLDALGVPLAQTHLAVRRAELAAMAGMTLEAEVDLLLDRY